MRFVFCTAAAGLIFALAVPAAVAQQPFRPADDRQVLERLHAPLPLPSAVATDPAIAAAQAVRYIEQARRTGDPRFLGYAEGLLRAWRDDPRPPATILVLRATLLQSRHDFGAALRVLDDALALDPGHPQALLTLAAVLRVQGRLAEAARACDRLRGHADSFAAAVCGAAIRGLRGDLAGAAATLDALGPQSRAQGAALRAWYAAERADMAERRGKPRQALAVYAGALADGADDPLLRAAMADLLLELRRPADALRITGENPQADVLVLRVALARRALGEPDLALESRLAHAYATARRRQEAHLREEARFALDVRGDAIHALALAQQNWREQREPADARLLAAAARAAGQPLAADPVRNWLRDTGLEDTRLEELLRAGAP